MNQEQVVVNFSKQKIHPILKSVKWSGGNVFCSENILYSNLPKIGPVPIAVNIGNKNSLIKFIKNSNRYNPATGRHQDFADAHCNGPSLPLNALTNEGIPFTNLELKNILFYQEGSSVFLYKNKQTGSYYKDIEFIGSSTPYGYEKLESSLVTPPSIGTWRPSKKQKNDLFECGWFNVDELTVIRWKKTYYLVSRNKVRKLSRKPNSLDDAIELRQAQELQNASNSLVEVFF